MKNTTWVLGETPTKTMRKAAGCWVDTPKRASRTGKVGKQHSSLVKFGHTGASK